MKQPAPNARETRSPTRRAFTLVELIVATVMLAILVTATYTAIAQVLRVRDRGAANAQAFQRAGAAVDLIASEAEMALRDSDLLNAKIAIVGSSSGGGASTTNGSGLLLFTGIARPIRPYSGQNEGGESESQFRLEPSADGRSTLWHRRAPVPDDHPDAGGVAVAMVDGIVQMTIEASDGASWLGAWDSDSDGLPHALRVSVTASDDTGRTTRTARRMVSFDRTPVPPTETSTASTTGSGSTTGTGTTTPTGGSR